MKQVVLARPNLKLFVLGAIVIALLAHFVGDVRSQGPLVVKARPANPADPGAALRSLLEQLRQKPTSEMCNQISSIYHQKGDFKKAIVYLRQAEILAEDEE